MATPSFRRFTYDVFLSFRGEDTRYGFTGYLYKALCDRGLHTFMDDDKLQSGEEITPALQKAIEESRIAIIVLSHNYASSSFCLDELATILHCQSKGLLVIPVFYKVDPSNVRHQKDSYEEALAKHQKRFKGQKEKLHKWKMALHQVADFSGYHFKDGDAYQYEFIGRIVERVSRVINHAPLHVADYPVGLLSQVGRGWFDVIEMHDLIEDMGRQIDLQKSPTEPGKRRRLWLGKDILHVLKHDKGTSKTEIIILDLDLSIYEREKTLEWNPNAFRRMKNLKILIIRDGKFSKGPNYFPESLRVLEWHGYPSNCLPSNFDPNKLVTCMLPNSHFGFLGSSKKFENLSVLSFDSCKFLTQIPDMSDFVNLEEVSFNRCESLVAVHDSIGLMSKLKILQAEHCIKLTNFPPLNLPTLESLKLSFCSSLEKFPEILEKMENIRKLVLEKLPIKELPLSFQNLIGLEELFLSSCKIVHLPNLSTLSVTEDNGGSMGTRETEIICLDLSISEKEETLEWNTNAFIRMKNLKILIIRNGKFSKGPNYFPESLRVLEWHGYPSNCLPSNFDPNKLVTCKLLHSHFTSFGFLGSSKKFENLTVLNFDWCIFLTQTPDMSDLGNLEEVSFKGCESLVEVHDSVGFMNKLKILNAEGCIKLMSFPPLNLPTLERLELSFCFSLEKFPEILGKMGNIRVLQLQDLPIKELPLSFQNLDGLEELSLPCENVHFSSSIATMPKLFRFSVTNCRGWQWVKSEDAEDNLGSMVPSKVEWFAAWSCNLDDDFFSGGLMRLAHVRCLFLRDNNFKHLPECIKEFHNLWALDVSHCKHLEEIRGFPPKLEHFKAINCISLTSSSLSMLLNKELHEARKTEFWFPGASFPEWFDLKSSGPSCSFWFRNKFPARVLSLLIAPVGDDEDGFSLIRPMVFINGKVQPRPFYFKKIERMIEFDHSYLFDLQTIPMYSNLFELPLEKEWKHVKVTYEGVIETSIVRATGIHIFKEGNSEDIRFDDPYTNNKLDKDLNSSQSENHLLRTIDKKEKLQKWKMTLRQVADLSGYHFKDGLPSWTRYSRVLEVRKLLEAGCYDGVHMIGIHGMGGVGKSTLARAVYNGLIAENFDSLCFLENVREKSNKHGLEHLQSILISQVLGQEDINLTIEMHDLIENMGRKIDQKESAKEPGNRRRLWLPKDIIQVLKYKMGTGKIEIICLDFSISENEETIECDENTFMEMENLKILINRNVKFSKVPNYFPESLKVLEWHRYPSNCLPSNFHANKLVICKLPDSCFASFGFHASSKKFENLTSLNFDDCKLLTQIPDVSDLQNLEKLSFEWCESLTVVHNSVGFMTKLKILSAEGCSSLTSFPPLHLTSLERLELSYCSSLENFPEILGNMGNIKRLELVKLAIKELPISFQNLTGLKNLLVRCDFVRLSSIFMTPELSDFKVYNCKGWEWAKSEEGDGQVGSIVSSKLDDFIALSCNLNDDFLSAGFLQLAQKEKLQKWKMALREVADLSGYHLGDGLEEVENILDVLYDNDMKHHIGVLVDKSLIGFWRDGEDYIDMHDLIEDMGRHIEWQKSPEEPGKRRRLWLKKDILHVLKHDKELYESRKSWFWFPGARFPEWFDLKSSGPSCSFWFRNKFPARVLSLLIIHMNKNDNLSIFYPAVYINGKSQTDASMYLMEQTKFEFDLTYFSDLKMYGNLHEQPSEKEWNHVKVKYNISIGASIVKATGIHVFEENKKDIRFDDPYIMEDIMEEEEKRKKRKKEKKKRKKKKKRQKKKKIASWKTPWKKKEEEEKEENCIRNPCIQRGKQHHGSNSV
ncbi:hypothetical protein LR48_Vigan10g047400 [Vigna angularis]|uniref:TIR domain-containing protein n=1 Tax=Phaseolus angularis TaxID=3914 RepID=A0A0L9VI62_PHAAN|nr:hypothetical protein LR48_Vigan10g047400 [Vigna angularis]